MGILYRFPKLYAYITENFLYDEFETESFAALLQIKDLKPNAIIMDLACGSGEFVMELAAQRPDIKVIGIDFSSEMIEKCIKTAQDKALKNAYFVSQPILSLSANDITQIVGKVSDPVVQLDIVVCSYGFSAMDDHYADIFKHTASLLRPGGYYIISDAYYTQRKWFTRFFQYIIDNILLDAKMFRKPWRLLEQHLDDFIIHEKPLKWFGTPINLYVARGQKK